MTALLDRTATRPGSPARGGVGLPLGLGLGVLAALAAASLLVGVADLDAAVLLASRVPRTLALILAGAALATAGLVMQLLTRNHFTEPSTAGTLDFATLGLLVCALALPGAPVVVRMVIGTLFAAVGAALFLRLLRAVPLRDEAMVPLLGLMLGGVVGAATTFVAYRADLLQSITAWTTGDFSAVVAGRYELLWLAGLATLAAAVTADRFTVAGLGEDFSTNLGLDHRRTLAWGLGIVAVVSSTTVLTAGALPFLGLIVPNVVRRLVGDNARRVTPLVALGGAGLVLVCDLVARLAVHPFELPIGTVLGVLGAGVFLAMLLGRRRG